MIDAADLYALCFHYADFLNGAGVFYMWGFVLNSAFKVSFNWNSDGYCKNFSL